MSKRHLPLDLWKDEIVLVEFELELLRRADGLLVDMTISERNYLGCACELTYARLWRIPAVVYVGNTSNGERPWLRYHSSLVVENVQEAVRGLVELVKGSAAGNS
jgi:hypothetical protein